MLPVFGDIPRDTDHTGLPADLHLAAGNFEGLRAAVFDGDMRLEAAYFAVLPQKVDILPTIFLIRPKVDVENRPAHDFFPTIARSLCEGVADIQDQAVLQTGNYQVVRT